MKRTVVEIYRDVAAGKITAEAAGAELMAEAERDRRFHRLVFGVVWAIFFTCVSALILMYATALWRVLR